jgi:hypothetical protein
MTKHLTRAARPTRPGCSATTTPCATTAAATTRATGCCRCAAGPARPPPKLDHQALIPPSSHLDFLTFRPTAPTPHTHQTQTRQASNDLHHWVDLKRHIGDSSVRLPGQYASWPVSGPASHMPFRAFRLLLAGPTLSATTPWNFCLSHVEFYGYFFRAEDSEGGGGGGGAAATAGAAAGAS